MLFPFLMFSWQQLTRKSVWKQQSFSPVPPPYPGPCRNQWLGLLLAKSSRRYPSSTASTSSIEMDQSGNSLISYWPMAGREILEEDLWMPPVLGEGRILSNTSSQRPLGSQGWGWEKFPLGGVFTKPGVMSHVSSLDSSFASIKVLSESVENKNQIETGFFVSFISSWRFIFIITFKKIRV